MDFVKDLSEWIQALSETENETVVFLLETVLPVSATMFGFFASGLLLAYLIWAPYLKRLHAAREDNLMLTGRLNEIIEDQNVLLASLNEVHGTEKEKWHLKVASREDRLESLNGRLAELDADSSEIRAELASRDDKITTLQEEIEQSRRSEAEAISRVERKNNQIEGLKRDLSAGGALGKRVQELEALLEERDREREEFNQSVRETSAEQQSALLQLKTELQQRGEELQRVRGEFQKQNENSRCRLAEQEELLKERQREIESLRERVAFQADLRPRVEELESLLRISERELEESRNQAEAVKLELESTIQDLNRALASREEELSGLRNELGTVEQWQSRIRELEEDLAAKSRELDSLNGSRALAEELREKLDRLHNEPDEAARELQQLHQELAESREELGRVNRELEEALALIDEPEVKPSVTTLRGNIFEMQKKAAAREAVRIDLNSPGAETDDLKLIKGVGKVMEQKLHEYGVYRFQQIGQWTESVIEDFTEKLPFGNRVTRDDWVSQAKELHREKYGETV